MKELGRAAVVLLFLIVLTGLIYPLLITGIGQLVFSKKANGSLIIENNNVIGSSLIGQNFTSPRYFWGRPSDALPAYNPMDSHASNLGPTNPILMQTIQSRIAMLLSADPAQTVQIPIDLVTSSASGLDPDISVLSAEYQAERVAKARDLSLATVSGLIDQNTTPSQFGFMGQTRVNVLKLNLALDAYQK